MKTFDSALTARARELARCLAARSLMAVERPAEEFEDSDMAAGREFSAQALSELVRLLREVEAARDRLRDGSFGVCVRCEEAIPVNRLQAIPWAAHCHSCQAEAERAGPFGPALGRAA
jgi:DnaK suppressor protein